MIYEVIQQSLKKQIITCRINLAKMIITSDEGCLLNIYQQEQELEKNTNDGINLPPALVFHGSDQEDVKLQRLSEEVRYCGSSIHNDEHDGIDDNV